MNNGFAVYSIDDLLEFVENISNNGTPYDILVPISGGKDGMYLLDYLAKNTNKNILALTYDNGYISETTKKNTEVILKKLSVDSITYKADWIFSKELNKELILKMGEICFGCEMILNITVIKIAMALKIPMVAWGLSSYQMEAKGITSAVIKTDTTYVNYIINFYETIINKMDLDIRIIDLIEKKVLNWNLESSMESDYPYYIYPYFVLDYDPSEIEDYLKEKYKWVRPYDVGGISSNCVINQLHIFLKKKVRGNEFYRAMLDKKLDNNEITLSIYKKSLDNKEDISIIEKILEELNITISINELTNKLKSEKTNAYVRSQSNISI